MMVPDHAHVLHCEICGEPVHVEKRKMVGLTMSCGCEGNYSIKTAIALPQDWNNE